MISAKDVRVIMISLAAEYLCEEWDNVGLIIGRARQQVERILISLDYTENTRLEAIEKGCQMVITHHPPIFSKINKITDETVSGKLLLDTIQSDICVYSAHTNLDCSAGGTADALYDALELCDEEDFLKHPVYDKSFGKIGYFQQEYNLEQVCQLVKHRLGISTVKYVGNPEEKVKKIALMPGSGMAGEFLQRAISAEVDVYITGDVKYHDAMDAAAQGLNIIDATHFATENIVCEYIKNHLERNWEDGKSAEILLAETSQPPFKFI